MKRNDKYENNKELFLLCSVVRDCISRKEYEDCWQLIVNAMMKYPHAPEPHNLMGILMEKEGDSLTAMKHFRAAYALNPTYIPARCNLNSFGEFYSDRKCFFDETDCETKKNL